MIDTDTKLIIDTLKRLLKRENITYKMVAENLKLSEVSIKRIFSNYNCTLSKLSQICALVNTTLLEVSELAIRNSKDQNYFLSNEQDLYFSKSPFNFLIFREIYRGITLQSLRQDFNLSKNELFIILRDLEKLELLEIFENERIRFKISGQIRINLDGLLFENFIKTQNNDFLETVYKKHRSKECCLQSSELQLSKSSTITMVQEINSLGKKYREKAFLETKTIPQKDLIDIRWLFAFLPYKTNWKIYK